MTPLQFISLKQQAQKQRFEKAPDRVKKLKKLRSWIVTNEMHILNALNSDFKKPHFETKLTEIIPVLNELDFFAKNLALWMKDQAVPTPLTLIGHRSKIRFENKGVVLIISPWNYPFQLALVPLIAAIAAGNTVVVKPSELTHATSNLMLQMLHDCFLENEARVVLGDKTATESLLTYNFDHVFFTGSTAVGRLIAKACADKLIPVTLELGGKSPTIIDQTADLVSAAEKIFWGKFLNRGQTCVAPDYVVIHESKVQLFKALLQKLIIKHAEDIEGQIISPAHEQRLNQLCDKPTSVKDVSLSLLKITDLNHPAMREEIFGPVLPILAFKDFSDLAKTISHFDKPLSLYIFSKSKVFVEKVLRTFPSGSVGINAVIVQLANPHLPFGGIGASGSGKYHGHFGFLELSHQRAIMEQRRFHFLNHLIQPPYTKLKAKVQALFILN